MDRIEFRLARRDDAAALFQMIQELARHEGDAAHLLIDAQQFREAGFGAAPQFGAIVAHDGPEPVGFISYTWSYAIWRGTKLMNIDDVYVRPTHRSQGVGEAMMQFARAVAGTAGAERVRWEAKPTNAAGIRFYQRLGAQTRLKNVFFWAAQAPSPGMHAVSCHAAPAVCPSP